MEEIDIKDFLKYLKKFIIPAAAALVLAVAGVLIYEINYKTTLYKATTKVVLAQAVVNDEKSKKVEETGITLNDININQKLVQTYSEIAKSDEVLQKSIDKLGLETTPADLSKRVSVTDVTDTVIIKISVEDEDPEKSAEISNRIAKEFTRSVKDTFGLSNATILDPAKTPTAPSNDTLARDVVIAAFIAVFGVIAIAFIIYYFDNSIKYSDDLENKINMPVIGKIVKSDVDKKQTQNVIAVEAYPKSAVAESVKSLRTNLQFANVDKNFKTILVTSSVPSEGKTFTASNLATSFAQNGKKTLIVDCDLRKGRLHQVFNVLNTLGLSNLLIDDITKYKKYIQKTKIANLSVITRGAYPPNPSELLGSEKNRELIEILKEKFDIIIFDGAPCGSVTDSVIMSTLADEVLIVARDSKTTFPLLQATKEMLDKVNAPVAGTVMNAVSRKSARYYGYYGDK